MLKFFTKVFCGEFLKASNKELFYKLYKWSTGITGIVYYRTTILYIACFILSIVSFFAFQTKFLSLFLFTVAFLLYLFRKHELRSYSGMEITGFYPPSFYKTVKITNFIRKHITPHGKGITKKDWQTVKNADIDLYNDALSIDADVYSSYYALEIAKIIKNCTLIWGAVKEPIVSEFNYVARAVILKDGYIYDSQLWIPVPYSEYTELHKFMIFKKWNYDTFSKYRFIDDVRQDFRDWCIHNEISEYEDF